MKNREKNGTALEKFSYACAYLFVIIIAGCISVTCIAGTLKFITWLF